MKGFCLPHMRGDDDDDEGEVSWDGEAVDLLHAVAVQVKWGEQVCSEPPALQDDLSLVVFQRRLWAQKQDLVSAGRLLSKHEKQSECPSRQRWKTRKQRWDSGKS